ncbi:PadR family transcriptional regulator [Georgenia alba]|uniref:PadR family transcriptional regulator n=1 Tax=Georgenia alba TaxID=2233858 RepID=A0ABW2Q622_9MICO
MILQRIILGLLAIAPMSGYDLKRRFDSAVNYFWSADKAQIYRSLAALVGDGLVAVEKVPGRAGPDRQEHRITPEGRRALREWLTSELDRQPERDAFLARVFFAGDLDPDELATLLARQRAETRALLASLEAIREATPAPADRAARLRLATLERGLRHVHTELEWLDDLEKSLR